MTPRTDGIWLRRGGLFAFVVGVLVSWHHDGDGVVPVLLELVFIAGLIGLLWAAFLARKTLQRRRSGR